jgi:hypothetical protein
MSCLGSLLRFLPMPTLVYQPASPHVLFVLCRMAVAQIRILWSLVIALMS